MLTTLILPVLFDKKSLVLVAFSFNSLNVSTNQPKWRNLWSSSSLCYRHHSGSHRAATGCANYLWSTSQFCIQRVNITYLTLRQFSRAVHLRYHGYCTREHLGGPSHEFRHSWYGGRIYIVCPIIYTHT